MSVLMIFVDGVGLGPADPRRNPLAAVPMPVIRELTGGRPLVASSAENPGEGPGLTDAFPAADGRPAGAEAPPARRPARLVAVDACLGVPGLPQSATGQTTLLTGVNAAQALGRHLSGLPTETLVDILARHSLFKQLKDAGLSATFANPFTDDYFKAVAAGKWRHSSTTTAVLSAGMPVRMLDDLLAGRAVFHDVTGRELVRRGHDVPVVTPEEAGRRLAALAEEYDFTLFEHFLTDFAGHARDREEAERLLTMLDAFLGAVLEHVDLSKTTVMLISDHGNVEDLSVKTHTRNPVPGLFAGAGRDWFAGAIRSLTDVTPAIVGWLTGGGRGAGGRSR